MQGGSDKTFESLALPHFELLYRVARRLSGSEHEAEELVQETYLKAYKAFARFEEREFGIRPWLLRILNNTFLNNRARAKRAPRTAEQQELEERGGDGASHATEPNGELDYDHLDAEVRTAIEQLQPEFRSVLLMWAVRDLSYQEIADALEIPIGTVMSRLHRARQQLHKSLATLARENRWISTSRVET